MGKLTIKKGKEGYSFVFFLTVQGIFMVLQGMNGADGAVLATFFGVNLRAEILDYILLIAQFLNMSIYMLGTASSYLEGYGIYEITRICKKSKLATIVNSIILKRLALYETVKIIMLLILLKILGTGQIVVATKSLIYSVALSILIDYLLITVQMIIEVRFDSRIGSITISIMYIVLLMLPSVVGMGRVSPAYFLPFIPNLSMIARVDTQSIWYITFPFTMALIVISWVLFVRIIKRKDLI